MTSTLLLKSRFFSERRYWWLPALIWIALVSPVKALELRVAIVEGAGQVKVGSSTPAKIFDAAGRPLGELAPREGFYARPSGKGVAVAGKQSSQIQIEPEAGGAVYIGDRWYRGRTKLVRASRGLTAVNYVDLEHYLTSVLGKEMYPNWPQEALKAQAVASRSYALYQRQHLANNVYDVGDTTTWQVYEGMVGEFPSTQAAVAATTGQVLTYNGQIIQAVFHSASGGHTENVENVWSSPLPYLRGVPDFDEGSPVYQWAETFSPSALSQRIPGVGNITTLTPLRTTPWGRIVQMKVVGDAGTRVVTGKALRSALGLKSTLFTVTPHFGLFASAAKGSPKPVAFQVIGRGFGHGLGMSQWGAHNQAQLGRTHQQILQHYYQGTALSQMQVK